MRNPLVVIVWVFCFLVGCSSAEQDFGVNVPFDPGPEAIIIEADYPFPFITVVRTPGWTGEVRHATVDEGGYFFREQFGGIPGFGRQLSDTEQRSLVGLLINHTLLPEGERGPGCSDSERYEVEFFNQFYQHSYDLGCGLATDFMPSEIVNRVAFFREFNRLYEDLYINHAPWSGLEISFSFPDSNLVMSDTLDIVMSVINPTDSVRTLFFDRPEPFQVRIDYEGQLHNLPQGDFACIMSVRLGFSDECRSDSVSILPGQTQEYLRSTAVADLGFSLPNGQVLPLHVRPTVSLLYGFHVFPDSVYTLSLES